MQSSASPTQPVPRNDALLASYEAVAYEGKVIRLADSDAMAAIATLHGLTPPPPDRCRVLELGCAAGVNIMSLAFRSPKSHFVGVDFVPTQIEAGRLAVSAMGLANVELQARSIADIDDGDGTFDYIICHGVYSWVPPEVQDAILRVCNRNLSPNGVAYVSYNTYPGWHRRGMLRDMLMFHDDPSLDPDERVARARAFARTLASTDPSSDLPHWTMLREEAAQIEKQSDRHLFHEQLEPWNEPLYFAEFVRRAAGHGLAYLGEAEPVVETAATAQFRVAIGGSGADRVRMEQYLDFARGRTFRRTLLCHSDVTPALEPVADAIRLLTIRSRATHAAPAPEDAARGGNVAAFQSSEGAKVTTNNPLVVAMLTMLVDAAPGVVAYADLERRVTEHVAASAQESDDVIASDIGASLRDALLLCAKGGLVEFRVLPSRVVVSAGVRPKASALARWQALYSDDVTTLAHSTHKLSGMERFLIALLDGTRDRPQLIRQTEHAFTSGDLKLEGFAPTRENLSGIVDDVLLHLGRSGILVA